METLKYIFYLTISMLLVIFLTYFIRQQYDKKIYAHIQFEKTKHEFDTLISQKQAEVYFKFKNIGNKPLRIAKIETSCGCTIPAWNDRELLVNQSDSFKVNYNIENKGHFVKEIMVFSNSKTSPEHLFISGYVPFQESTQKK